MRSSSVSAIYVIVALCAVSVLDWQELAVSEAPFSDIVSTRFGTGAVIGISVIALFATGNTVLLSLYASSRILYGMAVSNALPRILAVVHPRHKTPWIAVLTCGLVTLVFLLPGDITFVANLTNFTLFITFMMINASVIVLRYRLPDIHRPFQGPHQYREISPAPAVRATDLGTPAFPAGLEGGCPGHRPGPCRPGPFLGKNAGTNNMIWGTGDTGTRALWAYTIWVTKYPPTDQVCCGIQPKTRLM